MLYLTCSMLSSIDLAHCDTVPCAKDLVSVDCGTILFILLFYAASKYLHPDSWCSHRTTILIATWLTCVIFRKA